MTIIAYSSNPAVPTAGGIAIITWAGLTGGSTGQPMAFSSLADKTVQVFGTIGGAISVQGSNDPNVIVSPSDAIWATLTDNFGNPLSFSSAGLSLVTEAPQFIRPICASGTTNATVIIVANAS